MMAGPSINRLDGVVGHYALSGYVFNSDEDKLQFVFEVSVTF